MLDEGAKEWLTFIESQKKILSEVELELKAQTTKMARIKAAAKRAPCEESLAALTARKTELAKTIESETELFFRRVFGVALYQSVALRRPDGTLSAALYATKLILRQLANGAGVFTVMGASASVDLHKGLPECVSLMAREAGDECFVGL